MSHGVRDAVQVNRQCREVGGLVALEKYIPGFCLLVLLCVLLLAPLPACPSGFVCGSCRGLFLFVCGRLPVWLSVCACVPHVLWVSIFHAQVSGRDSVSRSAPRSRVVV